MNRQRIYSFLFLLLACTSSYAQKAPFSFEKLFAKYPGSFDSIIAHKDGYRLQILYTRIDRDVNNVPHLATYSFDVDKYYYYCASMMKLPACALTLEKLNNLSKYRVNMLDSVGIDTIACTDLNPESMMLGTPYSCLSQYVKEMLLISNNNAFNPVYDFLGQYDFQERLHQLGYTSAVVSNRYAGCDTDQNRRCDPVSLFDRTTHKIKYTQPSIINKRRQFYEGDLSPLVGNGYLAGGNMINEPKSFRFSNYMKLSELHKLLTKIILPETQTLSDRFNLTRNDYQYLYKCMGLFPRECAYPALDSVQYPDNYMKYFMGIDSGSYLMPANIRIFNKVGQAYGFMTDCSYVVDTLNKVEFFLSCAMYLNNDGILNDGKYEYDQTGFPFFHNLFNAVYNDELMRRKAHLPKLSLPDFTDTPLVKPSVRPLWLKIDSTKSPEEMESVLCSLADAMYLDSKLFINYDNPTADEVFYRNFIIALRAPSTADYSFTTLLQRKISVITSADKRMRVFYWKVTPTSNRALFQFIDSTGHVSSRKLSDFTGGEMQSSLIYKSLNQFDGNTGRIYLLNGEMMSGTDAGEYLQAFGWKAGKPTKLKIFKLSIGKGVHLYDNILIEKRKPKDTITFNAKRKTLSYPLIVKSGKSVKTHTQKLKFDGTVFK